MSQVTQPWQIVLIFTTFIGLGMGTHDVVTLSTVARWFQKGRGVVTGLAKWARPKSDGNAAHSCIPCDKIWTSRRTRYPWDSSWLSSHFCRSINEPSTKSETSEMLEKKAQLALERHEKR